MNSAELEDKEISDLLKKIFTPLLLCLGTFGNIISIKIFCKDTMKKYTTFRYLTLLSVIDLCTLYTGCGQILFEVFFNLDIRSLNDVSCKMNSFLVYFFTHFSSMLLAAMSVDRTIAIISRNNQLISTPQTALKIFTILGVLLAVINVHFLFFTHLIDYEVPPNELNLTFNTSNETIQTIKICYGEFNSYYFVYISKIFPWYHSLFIFSSAHTFFAF